MGFSAYAEIVYGQMLGAPDSEEAWRYQPQDAEDTDYVDLYALLEGTPLEELFGGFYELPSVVVRLRGVSLYAGDWTPLELGGDAGGIGVLPEVDVRQLVNAKKLWRHLDELPGEFEPQWLLVPSYG